MISTSQALKEWDSILKLLADIKSHAAHPNNLTLPTSLDDVVANSNAALQRHIETPIPTWQQLVKKQVGMPADHLWVTQLLLGQGT